MVVGEYQVRDGAIKNPACGGDSEYSVGRSVAKMRLILLYCAAIQVSLI